MPRQRYIKKRDERNLKKFDWRDPKMPVLMDYVIENELGIVERGTEVVEPERATRIAQESLSNQAYVRPDWRRDPTYGKITGPKKAPSPRPITFKKSLIKW